jgi:hypothetical protein
MSWESPSAATEWTVGAVAIGSNPSILCSSIEAELCSFATVVPQGSLPSSALREPQRRLWDDDGS